MEYQLPQRIQNLNNQKNEDAAENVQMKSNVAEKSGRIATMDFLIDVICKLRSVFATINMESELKFPEIVVIEFNGDWATFDHLPDQEFVDFEKVCKEIQRETNASVGTNQDVSDDPIYLKIYSANVVNLTMVDLPGFTKVPVGDQPPDIETRIRDMALKYISNENSIILAVTPANQDFAASDSLKLAREVDKDGDRTLCVLTKLDLMDTGTDARRILMNEVLKQPVKLGIIGVVSRSQKDIENSKSVDDCKMDEEIFLKKHYPDLANKNGIRYLAKTLNELLLGNICKVLPGLKIRIAKMTSEYERKFHLLGEPIAEEEKDAKLVKIIDDFVTTLKELIDGNSDIAEILKEVGGALLFDVFYKDFANEIENIDPLDGLNGGAILIARKNIQSTTPEVFPAQKVFEALVKRQMLLLDDPCLRCVDSVHEKLLNIVDHCASEMQNEKNRFPILFERIEDEITSFLKNQIFPTKLIVETILSGHRAHINTKHPDFQDAIIRAKIEEVTIKPTAPSVSSSQPLTPQEEKYIELMNDLIKEYFNIILKAVQDQVPKLCMDNLVIFLKKNLQSHLIIELQKIQKEKNLLGEGKSTAQKRTETSAMLAALTDAKNVLNEIPETIL
uniref:Dynamin-1-like protein n=1 Tax=Panagrolaimus sp. ES5 TaxID=591445 RepID=A0AC34GNZ3_9BILA